MKDLGKWPREKVRTLTAVSWGVILHGLLSTGSTQSEKALRESERFSVVVDKRGVFDEGDSVKMRRVAHCVARAVTLGRGGGKLGRVYA